ncbi:MAG TPA: hypothetical protein VGD52_22945 [Pseudoduganella sp.]
MYVLNSVADAFNFLAKPEYAEVEASQIKIGGELAQFEAWFEGKNYHATIPTSLARGLWEFQEEMYRAAAFALYGEDDIRKLTDEQKAAFELIFEVKEGSSDLLASLEEFFSKLGEGFTTMESKHKGPTLVAIVLIVALAWGATHIVDSQEDTKQKEIAARTTVKEKEVDASAAAALETARTAQFQLISDITKQSQAAKRFEKATEEGSRSIIKSASDADRIRIGKISFDKSEIQEVTQRAVRERSEAKILVDDFYIVRIEFRDATSTKIWVASKMFDEFPLTIVRGDVTEDEIEKVIAAGKAREPLKMEINATMIRSQIRGAQIVRLL